jgi:hypothetical protein
MDAALLTDAQIRVRFDTVLTLRALSVPACDVSQLSAALRVRGALFDRPRLRSVVNDEARPEARLVLLSESAGEGETSSSRRGLL